MRKIITVILLIIGLQSFSQNNPLKVKKQLKENIVNESTTAKTNIGISDPGPFDPTDPLDPSNPIGPLGPPIDPIGSNNNGDLDIDGKEVGTTGGEVSVSLTGGANYSIPISLPPGINGVVPQIGLNYNSQSSDGNAGYGWNVSGISRITKVPSTLYHDGIIDPVDFDNLDRFALDGQRLILKTGDYGVAGSTYETENFSTLQISLVANGSYQSYFKVEYPDGSFALYGYFNEISVSLPLIEYPVTLWQNAQNLKINYSYYNFNTDLQIKSINYGTDSLTGINSIEFIYKTKSREFIYYVGGFGYRKSKILSAIKVTGNGLTYRNYYLTHDFTSTNFERLKSIQEKNGDNSKSLNPTVFDYEINQTVSGQSINYDRSGYSYPFGTLNSEYVQGDFSGDGEVEIINNRFDRLSGSLSLYRNNGTDFIPLISDSDFYSERGIIGVLNTLDSNLNFTNKNTFGVWDRRGDFGAITNSTIKIYSYNKNDNTINFEYEKKATRLFCGTPDDVNQSYENLRDNGLIANYSFVGDFNGDKLSELLLVTNKLGRVTTQIIDLDRRLPSDSNFMSGIMDIGVSSYIYSPNTASGNLTVTGTSMLKIGDYNGDGKTDLFILRGAPYNKIEVYSLINNSFSLISSTNYNLPGDIGDKTDKTNHIKGIFKYNFFINDFNGDGRSDIFLPYLGKILISNEGYNTEILLPNNFIKPEYPFKESYHMEDVNSDGKLDILVIKPILESESTSGSQTILIGTTPWYTPGGATAIYQTTIYNGYKYNHGLSINLFQQTQTAQWEEFTFSRIFTRQFGGIDLDVSDNNTFHSLRTPLFIRKKNNQEFYNELAIMGGDKITYLTFNRHSEKQTQLKEVVQGNGVTNTITYDNLLDGNRIYSKASILEKYPYYNLLNGKYNKVVSEISQSYGDYFKKRLFKYQGAIFDVSGRGIAGFQATMATNWFNDYSKIISNITKFDFTKNGVPKETYSVVGLQDPYIALLPTDSFINKSIYTYNFEDSNYINPLLANKVFKLYKTKTQNFNRLNNTSSITSVLYNANNNPTQITTSTKNGSTLEKTTVEDYTYSPLLASPYIIDRPLTKKATTTLSSNNDVSASEEKYQYDATLLKKVEKRSTNSGITTPYITEDNEYDNYGNIIQKKLSATGMVDRISSFEYDPTTHRFITKKTDIEGLITEYTYDLSKGLVLTETLPSNSGFPRITTLNYDSWGKKTGTIDYLGNLETITYGNTNYGVIIGKNSNDGSSSKIVLDKFGRTVQEANKGFEGDWSIKTTEYDIYDRPVKKSQPYFGTIGDFTGFTVWNEMNYDVYGRLTQSNSLKSATSQGKVTTYSYNNLTLTEFDGQKTKVTTKNASDNIISITENPGGSQVTYDYFANSNLKSTTTSGSTTSIQQDGWGRKKQLNDPSAGIYNYVYNNFGELTSEEVVGKGITTYNLDNNGKLISKTIVGAGTDTTNTSTTYTYDSSTKLLASSLFIDSTNNYTLTNNFGYNDYRVLNQTSEIRKNGRTSIFKFQKNIEFDSFGRPIRALLSALDYSSGLQSEKWIKNEYNSNGYQSKIINDSDGTVLWNINKVDASGQLLSASMTSDRKLTKTYDELGFPTQIKVDKLTNNLLTLNTQFDPVYGNLISRSSNLFSTWTENLTYDEIDRLKSYKNTFGVQTQTYNSNGTIATNNIGAYAYTVPNKPFQTSTVTPPFPSAIYDYYNTREQNIKYNVFKSPVSISELTKENIDFEYNSNNSRTAMYYGDLQPLKNNRSYRKYYSADGLMEIKYKLSSPTAIEFVTYIGGDGYSAPLILKSNGTTQEFLYLHRDYQGSIVAISNSTGVVVEKRMFDVWGSLIQYANSSGITSVPTNSTIMLLDRGYTGHEHLLGVGLINMNGRVYDDKLHKFLQPDNNIQDPYNIQNFNRYGYGLNNPTKYTDQSGEFLDYLFAFLFSTYVHGAQATGNANPFQWNAGQYANAIMGASSILVSNYATNISNKAIENYGQIQENLKTNFVSSNSSEAHGYVAKITNAIEDLFSSNNGLENKNDGDPPSKYQKWFSARINEVSELFEDVSDWGSNVGIAAKMTFDWATGTGVNNNIFAGGKVANSMSNAFRVNQARDFYYNKYSGIRNLAGTSVKNFEGSFGLKGIKNAGLDPIEQFVGSYRIDIYNQSGKSLRFVLTNTTSVQSFLYGIGPEYNRTTFGPGGNTTQTYIWNEPVRR